MIIRALVVTVLCLVFMPSVVIADNKIRIHAPITLKASHAEPVDPPQPTFECDYAVASSFYTYRRKTNWPADAKINGMSILWKGEVVYTRPLDTSFGTGRSFDQYSKDGWLYTPGEHKATFARTWPTRKDWYYEICRTKL